MLNRPREENRAFGGGKLHEEETNVLVKLIPATR
jgi:hypothetical protein